MSGNSKYTTDDNYPPQNEEELALLNATRKAPEVSPTTASAEEVAAVIADIRKGKVQPHKDKKLTALAWKLFCENETVVDATAIYDSMMEQQRLGKPIHYYEDHPCIAPPWDQAIVAYQNEHGNLMAMNMNSKLHDGSVGWEQTLYGDVAVEDIPNLDWSKVKWVVDAFVWIGDSDGRGRKDTPLGPVHMWRIAIYPNGEPADLSWVNLTPQYPMQSWDMAFAVFLGTLNFMNCRNVELVEPKRPRPEKRRIQKQGVTVKTLNIFPVGKSSRSKSDSDPVGTALSSVRGHFSNYGPKFGRKLLFGKYEGRFWVPQHVRGDSANGVIEKDYRPKP